MINKLLFIVFLLLLFNNSLCFADIFLDNNAGGCSNEDTDYDPSTRTCGSGSDTIYTSLDNAISGVSAGTQETPVVINIRSGTTYSMSSYSTINKAWTTWQKYSSDSGIPTFDWNWAWDDNWSFTGMLRLSANGIVIDEIKLTRLGYDSGDSSDTADAIQSGQAVEDGTGYSNLTIKNCEFSYIGHSGISIRNASNVTIDNNIIYEADYSRSELGGFSWAGGINITFGTDTTTISNNTIYNSGGEGIQSNKNVTNLTIRDNVLYNIAKPAIYIMHTQNSDIYRNLVYHTGNSRFESYHCGIMVSGESDQYPSG